MKYKHYVAKLNLLKILDNLFSQFCICTHNINPGAWTTLPNADHT